MARDRHAAFDRRVIDRRFCSDIGTYALTVGFGSNPVNCHYQQRSDEIMIVIPNQIWNYCDPMMESANQAVRVAPNFLAAALLFRAGDHFSS
jgi:hypothetical protein